MNALVVRVPAYVKQKSAAIGKELRKQVSLRILANFVTRVGSPPDSGICHSGPRTVGAYRMTPCCAP